MTELKRSFWLEKIKSRGYLPTPYILTDLNIVEQNARQLKELLPKVKIYYAVKSNPHLQIIECLDDIVEGYDIASLGEWELLKKHKVKPGRILFSNPVKVTSHIEHTFNEGVRHYALDSLDEIKKLSEFAPGSNVYLRVQVSNYGSKFPLSRKYGVLPTHIAEYAAMARDLGLKVRGLAFHVGSQAENLQVWETAFKICSDAIKRLELAGIEVDFLDIGGGFPANYGQPIPSIAAVCKFINKAIEQHIPKSVEVVAEPGRFIVAGSSIVVTEVTAREHRSGVDWLYLDMGVFQGLMEPLEMKEWQYPIFTDKNPRGYKKTFTLTGPSCDAYDTLGDNYSLPSDINRGDKLYIASAGAYTSVYGSNFNGFQMPRNYFV